MAYRPGAANRIAARPRLGGFITDFQYDWRAHKLPPKQVAQADPLQFMLLEAADEALKDAGYDRRQLDRAGVGVVVGTEFGGDFACQLQMGLRLPAMQQILAALLARRGLGSRSHRAASQEQFAAALLDHWPALIDETGSFSTSSLASRIGKTWDLMGGAATHRRRRGLLAGRAGHLGRHVALRRLRHDGLRGRSAPHGPARLRGPVAGRPAVRPARGRAPPSTPRPTATCPAKAWASCS